MAPRNTRNSCICNMTNWFLTILPSKTDPHIRPKNSVPGAQKHFPTIVGLTFLLSIDYFLFVGLLCTTYIPGAGLGRKAASIQQHSWVTGGQDEHKVNPSMRRTSASPSVRRVQRTVAALLIASTAVDAAGASTVVGRAYLEWVKHPTPHVFR